MRKYWLLLCAFIVGFTPAFGADLETVDNDAPSATPPANVVKPPAKENFHIYLLMGQSNMAGRDTKKLSSQAKNPRILALAGDNQWVVAKDPMFPKQGRTEPGAGPGIPFAEEMLKADPKVTIGLIPLAVGGTPLKRWVKNGDLYKIAVERAKAMEPYGTIKGVIWHQGETDTTKQPYAETYEARLTKMIGDFRTDLGQPNLPFVVGQLGDFLSETPAKYPFVEPVRAALVHIPTVVPNVGFADSKGLKDKGDKLHFNAEGAKDLGKNFAEAMLKLQKK